MFVPLFAFISALITVMVVYALARRGEHVSILSFVLAGVVVGAFTWASLTFILTVAPNQTLEKIVFWTMGSLAGAEPWSRVTLLAPFTLLCSLTLYSFARDLNIFALGEESAKYLGLRVESLKRIIIVVTTLLTAAAVSVSGTIGFVGLMVPHMARRIVGPDNRLLLPAAALLGAILDDSRRCGSPGRNGLHGDPRRRNNRTLGRSRSSCICSGRRMWGARCWVSNKEEVLIWKTHSRRFVLRRSMITFGS